ncbi:MAG: hypothetical protein Q8M08_14325 [Bacteroidales bacterium]|nr:hypothetical protein [Bacteroidales bacterium]
MMNRTMRFFGLYFIFCIVIFSGCGHGKKRLNPDISNVKIEQVKIHRYDLDLFTVNPDQLQTNLEALKPAYLFFLDTDLSDPAKLAEMKAYLESPRNQEFHAAVVNQYKQITSLEKDLSQALKHYGYYYPGFKVPRIYTYISGGDYDYPVQFADSVLLIGLDNYLGKDFKPYVADGLPAYRISRMSSAHVVPDCMRVLGMITYPVRFPGNTMLEQMIDAGKRLLFVDAMIPQTEDRLKIGYSKEQYDWVVNHEAHVWTAIIENRILYTTDGKLIRSFMADGPFMAEFSKDAPTRLGAWLGWQIVRKYYENQPKITFQEVMTELDAQKILTMSGYKPQK